MLASDERAAIDELHKGWTTPPQPDDNGAGRHWYYCTRLECAECNTPDGLVRCFAKAIDAADGRCTACCDCPDCRGIIDRY